MISKVFELAVWLAACAMASALYWAIAIEQTAQ